MPESSEALRGLIEAYTQPLFAGALAQGFSPADAEELVQDTFAAYLKAKERFEGRSTLKTFLFGILYNKGAELSRKRTRETATEDLEAAFDARFDGAGHWLASQPKGPDAEAQADEVRSILAKCAEGLSHAQRTAFFLKEAEGATSEEACNVLGVSDTNLRVLLHRARLRLRECLERSWGQR
ncbi:MAG: sigma-70 family RNA polymerase sigma factor [Elusimicrobia bacterium]|nr:sigma-70 family RNA polymerase sigma factor [Elusimicrobiota bacterium]